MSDDGRVLVVDRFDVDEAGVPTHGLEDACGFIALYYTSLGDVGYTPVYDIVTTQAYPRYAASPPGLSVEGRRTWAPGKALERFFNTRLGIAPRQYADMVRRLCDSAVTVAQEVIDAARNEPRWRIVARQMVHAWNEGMLSLSDPKIMVWARPLDDTIAAVGFSEP